MCEIVMDDSPFTTAGDAEAYTDTPIPARNPYRQTQISEGDEVRIIGNSTKHRFALGETGTVIEAGLDHDLLLVEGVYWAFLVGKNDVELVRPGKF